MCLVLCTASCPGAATSKWMWSSKASWVGLGVCVSPHPGAAELLGHEAVADLLTLLAAERQPASQQLDMQ